MTTALRPAPADELARVDELLDLTAIRGNLADPEEGPGYTVEDLDAMEREYRRFLALRLAHPDATIVPCKLVDVIWHAHILDTIAYAEDCERLFGRFVHHFPYFGTRGPDDAQDLVDAYADTLGRYRNAWGEPPEGTWVSRDATTRCRTQCKPMRCR